MEGHGGGTNKVLLTAVATLATALGSVTTIMLRSTSEPKAPSAFSYMTEEQVTNRLKLELRPIEQALDSSSKTNEALTAQLSRATEKIQQLEVKMSELIVTVAREGRRVR